MSQLQNNCNLTTCRYNKDGKCTNEEKREECVKVAEKVLVDRLTPSELLMRLSDNIGNTEALKKFGIEIDLSKPETIAQLRNAFTDTCDTNPNCENDPTNCGYAVEYSTLEDVGNGIHKYMCGRDKCKYCK